MNSYVFAMILLLASLPSLAASGESLSLSPTLEMSWSKALHPSVLPLPAYRGFRLEGERDGKLYSISINRQVPDTISNLASVKRLWSANLKATEKMGEKTQDFGCKETERHVFRCDGIAQGKSGEHIAQALIWNLHSDLAAVRATSRTSREAAFDLLGSLEFKVVNRMPAGRKK